MKILRVFYGLLMILFYFIVFLLEALMIIALRRGLNINKNIDIQKESFKNKVEKAWHNNVWRKTA